MPSGFTWFENSLTPRLIAFTAVVDQVFQQEVENFADDVQQYAQDNAPWEDRTGEARDGLTAEATTHPFHYVIDIFHTVEYGIWLEVRWAGKYAIILPTIEAMGPKLMAELDWGL